MADTSQKSVFRPARVLKELLERKKVKSYLKLEQAIAAADRDAQEKKRATVDRRKLRRLVELLDKGLDEATVTLTIKELLALDRFLTPLGEGLADKPIFEKPAALRSFTEKGWVTIALGAYPRDPDTRSELNWWDARSMATIIQSIEKNRPGTQWEVEDLRFTGTGKKRNKIPDPPPFLGEAGPSVCCLGSPRACYAAEFMLAEMLGMKAFKETPGDAAPFRLIWSPKATRPHPSAFRGEAAEIEEIDKELAHAIEKDKAWGVLRIDGSLFPVRHRPAKESVWTAHGIVVAQRRPRGQVWMVLVGLSGPATHACATAVAAEMTGAVPDEPCGIAPVRWDVVECTVRDDARPGEGADYDRRAVVSQRVVDHGWFSASSHE